MPILAQAGRDQMQQVDPGCKRRSLEQVLAEVPQLTALVDSFLASIVNVI